MFLVNDKGNLRNKFVKKEALKMLLGGAITIMILLSLSYVSMSKWPTFFFATSPIILLIGIIGYIIAPIIMLKRHNRTIEEISFEENKIVFKVFSALWLKSKKIELIRGNFEIIESSFIWYGKGKKKGVIIRLRNYEEYYLVSDYFDEYELIINSLNRF